MAKKYEPKGSLSLRSDHMDYGRATLVSHWHNAREAEPKDHDVHGSLDFNSNNRKLHQSTYDRILNITDGIFLIFARFGQFKPHANKLSESETLPQSTTHDYLNQINLREDFKEPQARQPMISMSTFHHTEKTRTVNAPEKGFGSILPGHPADQNKRYLDTTYNIDYRDTYPYKSTAAVAEVEKDYTAAHKKCHSQFTDVDDHRRLGRNTWHDQSGAYANAEIKSEIFKPTDTIPERLQ